MSALLSQVPGPVRSGPVCLAPQVWSLDLSDPAWDVAGSAGLLTEAERTRAGRGAPHVWRRRVLLRAALRRVLGGLLDLPAAEVPLAVTDGRPHLVDAAGVGGPEVSCSASGDVGLVAISWGARVGVDVQRHDGAEAAGALEEGWLTTAEQTALARLAPADRLTAITRCWTQKEAVLKGLGIGLRRSPATLDTPVAASGRIGAWSLTGLDVPPGHLASLAVETAADVVAVQHAEPALGGGR